jgi:hypothetical protein
MSTKSRPDAGSAAAIAFGGAKSNRRARDRSSSPKSNPSTKQNRVDRDTSALELPASSRHVDVSDRPPRAEKKRSSGTPSREPFPTRPIGSGSAALYCRIFATRSCVRFAGKCSNGSATTRISDAISATVGHKVSVCVQRTGNGVQMRDHATAPSPAPADRSGRPAEPLNGRVP